MSTRALLLALAAGCTSSASGPHPNCGGGACPLALPEGGEIRHEHVTAFGAPAQTWLQVYQYTGPSSSVNAPFADPGSNGVGIFGNCVDERQLQTWPFTPISGATYLTLPHVLVSGPGMPAGGLDVVETNPPNQIGNSTFRHYDFTYGGGQPGSGFNATLSAAQSQPGADYVLDIGKAGCGHLDANNVCDAPAATPDTMAYRMPDAYTPPLGIGSVQSITIPAQQDLELSWAAPPNPIDNDTHYFSFTLFVDPSAFDNPPQFICFPDTDGHELIPKAVIDLLPLHGLVMHGDLTHILEQREAAPGEMRRFDLVAAFENISEYSKM